MYFQELINLVEAQLLNWKRGKCFHLSFPLLTPKFAQAQFNSPLKFGEQLHVQIWLQIQIWLHLIFEISKLDQQLHHVQIWFNSPQTLSPGRKIRNGVKNSPFLASIPTIACPLWSRYHEQTEETTQIEAKWSVTTFPLS